MCVKKIIAGEGWGRVVRWHQGRAQEGHCCWDLNPVRHKHDPAEVGVLGPRQDPSALL